MEMFNCPENATMQILQTYKFNVNIIVNMH